MNSISKKINRLLLRTKSDNNLYQQYDLTYSQVWLRIIAFLGDLVLILSPIVIWVIIFLLVTGNMANLNTLYAATTLLMIIITIFLLIGNTYVSFVMDGQSFGKLLLNLCVVKEDGNICNRKELFKREFLGKFLPFTIIYMFLGIKITLLVCLIDGVILIFDKKHRSIIDFITHTKVVILDKNTKVDKVEVKEIKKEEKIKSNEIDLHVYSSFSFDGYLGVEEIFKQANENNINVVSITDHNNIKANLSATKLAPLYNIDYIPGISIDCDYNGFGACLLGYYIDYSDERYTKIEYENLAKEKAVSLRRIELFEKEVGIQIDTDRLLEHNKFQIITVDQLVEEVLTNPKYQNCDFMKPYLNINNRIKAHQKMIEDYFAYGCKCYVEAVNPDLKDIMDLIHETGGICVLAHPMKSFMSNPKFIEEIIELGVDGLEIFSPYHDEDDMEYLIDLAKKYNLDIITEGSEYSGNKYQKFALGKTNCPVDAEIIVSRAIKSMKKRLKK